MVLFAAVLFLPTLCADQWAYSTNAECLKNKCGKEDSGANTSTTSTPHSMVDTNSGADGETTTDDENVIETTTDDENVIETTADDDAGSTISTGPNARVIGGYFPNWGQYHAEKKFVVEDIQADKITHLFYAFAFVGASNYTEYGNLTYAEGVHPYALRHVEWNDIEYACNYCKVNKLKEGRPHLKTLISVGGWNFSNPKWTNNLNVDKGWHAGLFSEMASKKRNRKKFIKSVFIFCRKHGFDGVDLDWEYPAFKDQGGVKQDKKNFAKLLTELRQSIEDEVLEDGSEKLLLTIAVTGEATKLGNGYDVPKVAKACDFINVMTYDFYGSWTTDQGAALHSQLHGDATHPIDGDEFVQNWIKAGAPASKLVYGISTYGRGFSLVTDAPNQEPGAMVKKTSKATTADYPNWKIEELKKNNTAVDKFDETKCAAYTQFKDVWVGGYDTLETVACKVDYIKEHNLRGAFMWDLTQDDVENSSPVLSALGESLKLLPISEIIGDADNADKADKRKIRRNNRRNKRKNKRNLGMVTGYARDWSTLPECSCGEVQMWQN